MGARLVRDDALAAWTVPGAEHQVRPVRGIGEHIMLLRKKLLEEAGEVAFADDRGEIVKELADVWEVVRSIAVLHAIDPHEVLAVADYRRQQSGGFERGLVWETGR